MDWAVISAVAEASAAFGVVGSLIFVGFQVRQNSAGLRHAAVQSHISAYQDLYSNVINSGEMAEILWRGVQDPTKVDGPELLRFFTFTSKILRTYQGLHWQWEKGVLDAGLFTSMSTLLEDMSVTPGWQYVWRERRHQYDPSFQKFMDKMMADGKGKALFPVEGEAETE